MNKAMHDQRGRRPQNYRGGSGSRGRVQLSRVVAYETLLSVDIDSAYANLILPQRISQARLDKRDASFATELAYGTLRNLGRIDWVLSQCINRPLDELDPQVRAILRMTAHQILHLRVPDHAAVAQSVELAKQECERGAEKFINGVSRSIVEQSPAEWERRIQSITNDAQRVSVQYSHPEWIVRAFAAALVAHGRDPRELEELLHANNTNPWVTLCARPGLILPADLADDVEYFLKAEARPGDYSEWSVVISGGDPGRLFAVRDGRAVVQDEGSQLVASALAEVEVEGENHRWLDMCAGPGGKAGLLGAIAATRSETLLANEIAPHRAELVENSVRELGNVEVVVGDGRQISAHGTFHRILLDAPCTGLGALRRRPESRWRRTPADVPPLVSLQAELIDEGVRALAPGGVLAYVTCSPHEQETIRQMKRIESRGDIEFLSAGDAVDSVSMSEIELRKTPMGAGNVVQLWPHIHSTDAMFLALVRKVK